MDSDCVVPHLLDLTIRNLRVRCLIKSDARNIFKHAGIYDVVSVASKCECVRRILVRRVRTQIYAPVINPAIAYDASTYAIKLYRSVPCLQAGRGLSREWKRESDVFNDDVRCRSGAILIC